MLIEPRDAYVNVVRYERSYSFALRGDAFVFQPASVREEEKLLERRQNAREAIEIRRPSAFTCRTFPIESGGSASRKRLSRTEDRQMRKRRQRDPRVLADYVSSLPTLFAERSSVRR